MGDENNPDRGGDLQIMNIKRAKEEIKDTIEAYLLKDEYGAYEIPVCPPASGSVNRAAGGWKDADYGADLTGMRN